MRHGRKTTITVGGFIDYAVEMWDEHNHAQVWSGETQIFDGYAPDGFKVYEQEINRIKTNAEACGLAYTVR